MPEMECLTLPVTRGIVMLPMPEMLKSTSPRTVPLCLKSPEPEMEMSTSPLVPRESLTTIRPEPEMLASMSPWSSRASMTPEPDSLILLRPRTVPSWTEPFRYCPVKGCGWTEPEPDSLVRKDLTESA